MNLDGEVILHVGEHVRAFPVERVMDAVESRHMAPPSVHAHALRVLVADGAHFDHRRNHPVAAVPTVEVEGAPAHSSAANSSVQAGLAANLCDGIETF